MNKNTIWITGASGRLGSALVKLLSTNMDNKVIGTDIDLDITDSKAVMQNAEIYRPSVIINCASIADVTYCEEHMVEAFKVNALGARNLAAAARHLNAKIIQLSTDDIFWGNKQGALTEFDTPVPITVYGKSKLAGENFVRELTPRHLIIRSSWVYGFGAKHEDFFTRVCKAGEERTSIEVPTDVISSPTSAAELAQFIVKLIASNEYGTFHASCEGQCTRAEFAKAVLSAMGYDEKLVVEVSGKAEDSGMVTVLENLMMKMTEIYEMPAWEDDLKNTVEAMKNGR